MIDSPYIDDIVQDVLRVLGRIPQPDPHWNGARPDPGTSSSPYRVYNIGNNQPVELLEMIPLVEQSLGRTAKKNFLLLTTPTWVFKGGDRLSQLTHLPDQFVRRLTQRFIGPYGGVRRPFHPISPVPAMPISKLR